jgi:hypothetical protein
VEAVEQYRAMLRSIDEQRDEIRTDPLQVFHILHNLHEVLSMKPPGVGHTLLDSELEFQVRRLENCCYCFLNAVCLRLIDKFQTADISVTLSTQYFYPVRQLLF